MVVEDCPRSSPCMKFLLTTTLKESEWNNPRLIIRVIGSLMAVPEADMDQIQVWADNMTNLLFADLPAEQQLSHAQGYLALQQYVYNMVEQRQKAPHNDLVSDL